MAVVCGWEMGGGGYKISANFSSNFFFFFFAKTFVTSFESQSYLAGGAAAEVQCHPSNMNVLFSI